MAAKTLIEVSNAFFKNRNLWNSITDEDKSLYFFIFNRYFSKKYPELSQLLNDKTIDKVSSMDIWFHFMKNKPYPNWFWSKSQKKENNIEFTEKDINLLLSKLNIKYEELQILIQYHNSDLKEELKYYKSLEK